MPRKFSTLWRFLLPVVLLLVAAPFVLTQQQTAQKVENIEASAHEQASSLIRLLSVIDALIGDQADAAILLLKERAAEMGVPSIDGTLDINGKILPNLQLGHNSQAKHFELVDGVSHVWGGTATLFVKSGHDFVRIATNVRHNGGNRATGTLLDPHGKAIAALNAGKSFHGVVDILGEPYITRYEPMLDALGTVIGAYYVGYKVDMKVVREAVEQSRFLDTGFVALVDEANHLQSLSSHVPRSRVEQLLNTPSPDWNMVSETLPSWGFKVIVAYPIHEARVAGLISSLFVIGAGTLLGGLLIAIILWQLRRLILNPIGGDPAVAIDVVQRITAGNFAKDDLKAKPDTLMANVLQMRKKLREMVNTLHQNAERMSLSSSVFEHAHDGIFITDAEARIIEVNPAFTKVTGYDRDEALGQTPWKLGFSSHDEAFFIRIWREQQGGGEWRGETWNRHKSGDVYAAWLDLFVMRDEQQAIRNYVGVFSDITSAKEHQQSMEHLAYHDQLTQLPNRVLFADRLQQSLARAVRSTSLLAVCYFDLDNFKPVNDTLGHEAGDRLLVQLASRVRTCLRESDTIARLGGDEFALLLCDLKSIEECGQTLDRLLDVINMPFMLDEESVHVSASIGYTIFPLDDSEPDTLLRHADHAMYQAKMNGGSRYHLFDAEHDRLSRSRRLERGRIEVALPSGEFRLYYQPKVDMRSGQVVGMEALIRWQHPEFGLRFPSDFLPAVEDTDFAIAMGEWGIQEALRQIGVWQQNGLNLKVSVNIAARHMMQLNFAARLALILQGYPDVSPRQLELEITETAAIEDIAGVARIISSCKLMGVSFALDDFGVGYSSLTYLRRLPVETIKIDQSFVRDMLHDSDDRALIAGVISLSREFERQVVAEGVETPEHGLQLLKMGCHLAQGYGIAKPMPAEAVPSWVRDYKPDQSWHEDSSL